MQKSEKKPKNRGATMARLTRAEVARVLGCSKRTVTRLDGELTPNVDKNGVHTYDAGRVSALAAVRRAAAKPTARKLTDGELAATVFELLKKGRQLDEIVIELRVAPSVVRELHAEWATDLEAGYAQRLEREARR